MCSGFGTERAANRKSKPGSDYTAGRIRPRAPGEIQQARPFDRAVA